MNQNKDSNQVAQLEYNVEFPEPKAKGFLVEDSKGVPGLSTIKTMERIGGKVIVSSGLETLITIQYEEDLSPSFTFHGYTQRAMKHAESVVNKTVEIVCGRNITLKSGLFEIKSGSVFITDAPIFDGTITSSSIQDNKTAKGYLSKKRLVITISNLELSQDGLTHGTTVSFRVLQGGRLLLADSISGKASAPHRRVYEVDATDDELIVEHDGDYLKLLVITASLES